MAEYKKYEKYILTDLKTTEAARQWDEEHHYAERATRILWLEDEIIKGASSVICSWYWKATEEEGSPSHVHDFDEVVGFLGGDPQNPSDLGGEVEFWMEDEQYIFDKSFCVYIPENVMHCPLKMHRVDRPMFHFTIGPGEMYT